MPHFDCKTNKALVKAKYYLEAVKLWEKREKLFEGLAWIH